MSTPVAPPRSAPIQTPDLTVLLGMYKEQIFATLNCHQVGKIQSFNETNQTATISLSVSGVVYNKTQVTNGGLQQTPNIVTYPVLVDCPVFVLSGGGGLVTMPIAAGDSCLVLFNDRDLDNWFTTGATAVPNSPRKHDLSDGMALVGFRSLAASIASYSTTDIELRNAGGKIQVASKIGISNASSSLKTGLDQLCTALTSWIALGGGASSATTAAAINTAKTTIDSVLK